MTDCHSVAIIGAGPAGMAAAIQLKRYGIDALLFEPDAHGASGSLLCNAWRVENYLGFSPGIAGIDLLQVFYEQLRDNNISPLEERVILLDYLPQEKRFTITTDAANIYYAEKVIVASGTVARQHPVIAALSATLPPEKINYEIFPLLPLARRAGSKRFAIVGAGDAAFDYALNLLTHDADNAVAIFNHTAEIKALPLLQKLAFSYSRFSYFSRVKLVNVASFLPGSLALFFEDDQLSQSISFECDHLIAAIGRTPRKNFYSDNLCQCEATLVKSGLLKLIGDVQGDVCRQTALAVADGIRAAMDFALARLRGEV